MTFNRPQRAAADDAVDRLTATRLEAVHQARLQFQSERREVTRPGPLREFRVNLHVHSKWSHDSRGTIEDIVVAAKKAGSHVVMFTEHPAEHFDFVADGHQGIHDGVLLIPGAETKGLLAFPTQSMAGFAQAEPQEYSDLVRRRGGLVFLSHLEERMDWALRGITGVEIYNTHADVKDERRLLAKLKNPLWLVTAAQLLRDYPQESFSALQDYPADYLRRWDQLCAQSPHTGISANDAHQNIGLVVRLTDDKKARFEDALGERLLDFDLSAVTRLLGARLAKDVAPGGVLFEARLDRYEFSLRHVATHVLARELSDRALREALEAGQAFVAFDWIADATGFDAALESARRRFELGSRVGLSDDLQLTARAPLAAQWKLLCNSTLVAEHTGRDFTRRLDKPGIYRLELWLDVAGERRPWILTNPFYVDSSPSAPTK